MHLNRKASKLVLAAAAPLILVGTVGLTGGVASAKKAPPNPVTCTVSTTVTFSPPLSVAGTPSSKGATGSTNVNSTYTCNGSPVSSQFSVTTAAAKDKGWASDGNSKTGYYLGLCGTFTSSAAKDLGKAVKNLPVAGGKLTGAKATTITNGTESGFGVTGTVVGGTYPTAKNGASITAYLTNDNNNNNLLAGCTGGPVSGLDIDSATSSATI